MTRLVLVATIWERDPDGKESEAFIYGVKEEP